MLLFFTDSHFRLTSPRARKDNFLDSMLEKLAWVVDYANANKVQAIIHGGDWFDRPDIPYTVLGKIIPILSRCFPPIYTVVGNHDIYGYNPVTFERSALSVLSHIGLINRLSGTPTIVGDYSLTGVDATFSLDKGGDEYVEVERVPDKISVHVVHGFLTMHEWPDVPCTTVESIKDTKADIILSGHEHGGFGPITLNGKCFCNPGSLARVTASIGDVNTTVKIAAIKGKDVSFIPCPVAKPGEEVLDREKLVQEKENKKQLERFTKMIGGVTTEDSFDIYASLYSLCKSDQISESVMEICRKKLEQAEEITGKEVQS